MPSRTRTFFHSIGHAFAGMGETLAEARYLNELYNTPETRFRACGTTRDAAIRAALRRR